MHSTIGYVIVFLLVGVLPAGIFVFTALRRPKSVSASVAAPIKARSVSEPTVVTTKSKLPWHRPIKPAADDGFRLASAVERELRRTHPNTARSIYRRLRRRGFVQPFSVGNIQAILDNLARTGLATYVVPSTAPSGRLRRNHTTYRLAA